MGTLICGQLGREVLIEGRGERTELYIGWPKGFTCLVNHLMDIVPAPWISLPTLRTAILVAHKIYLACSIVVYGTSPPLTQCSIVWSRSRGQKGIDSEYHFLPGSFEPHRGAHFFQRLRLSPSTAQGRSRMIDRDRDEEWYACH